MFKEGFPSSVEPVKSEAEQRIEEGKKFTEERFNEIKVKCDGLNSRERDIKEETEYTVYGNLLTIKEMFEKCLKQDKIIGIPEWDAICLYRAENTPSFGEDTKSGVAKECPGGADNEPFTLENVTRDEKESFEAYANRMKLVRQLVMENFYQDPRKAAMFTGSNEAAMWERVKEENKDIRWQTDMPGIDIVFTERDRVAKQPIGSHPGTTRAILLKFYDPEKLKESI